MICLLHVSICITLIKLSLNKLSLNKTFLRPIFVYGIQIWGFAKKKSNFNHSNYYKDIVIEILITIQIMTINCIGKTP